MPTRTQHNTLSNEEDRQTLLRRGLQPATLRAYPRCSGHFWGAETVCRIGVSLLGPIPLGMVHMVARGGMFKSLCCAVHERFFYMFPYALLQLLMFLHHMTRRGCCFLARDLILLGLSCSCTYSGNALSSPLSPPFSPGALIDGQLCLQKVHSKDRGDLQQREGTACMPFLILLGATRASGEEHSYSPRTGDWGQGEADVGEWQRLITAGLQETAVHFCPWTCMLLVLSSGKGLVMIKQQPGLCLPC